MKLTTVLLIVSMLQVSATSLAQKTTFIKKNAKVKEVFNAVYKQTGYSIFWVGSNVIENQHIDANFKDATLNEIFSKVINNELLTYTIEGKMIVIRKKEKPSLFDRFKSVILQENIQGVIYDDQNIPLSYTSVQEKGTNNVTSSDKFGEFRITVKDKNAVLIFTHIGYSRQEIPVSKLNDPIKVILKPESQNLKEVVVSNYNKGYYTEKSELSTGSVGTITADDIAKQPVTNVLLAMQGKIPGLFITQASGLPNSTVNIQIRGTNTISQGVMPLYVIDGLPYTPAMLLNVGTNGSGQSSPLSFIDPAIIERVDVLKDADATAIYGSRGANGVILITTKKGTAGPTKFDINFYSGISTVTHKIALMNTDQFLAMRREAFKNDNIEPTADNAPDLFSWDPSRNVDWQKRLLDQSSVNHNGQIAMSGGNANSQFRAFFGYDRTEPPFPGNFKSEKISGGLNLSTSSINKRFRAQIGINYLLDQTYLPTYDPTTNITLAPNAPEPINPDGSLNFKDYPYNNPMTGFLNYYKGKTNNLVTTANLSYDIRPALTFKVTGGYNVSMVNGQASTTIASVTGNPTVSNPTGTSQFSDNTINFWIVEPQLSYHADILKGKIEALIGTTFQQNQTSGQLITGSGYTNDALLGSLAGSSVVSKGLSTLETSKFTSVYGRLNYNYEDKYLLNLTGRRDGSSRFGPNRKFGNFGAVGAGWIFSKESLVSDNLPFLSFGKIRASYGLIGNEPGLNYQYQNLHSFLNSSRPYQNTLAIAPDNLLSPDYSWEVVKKAEAGLELGFFKGRLLATVSYFKNISSNQLINYQEPAITGFNSILINRNAKVQNTGTEITLSSVNIKSSAFTWKTDFNITMARNKLISFPGLENSPYSGNLVVGLPLSIQARYRSAGVDPTTGLYQFYAKDGSLTFNPDVPDATYYISFDPKFYGGFENSLTYKQFDLGFLFQFVKQKGNNYVFSGSNPAGMSFSGDNNQSTELLDRWQKPGDIATYQKYTSTFADAYNVYFYQQQSNSAVVDASFIRLKNVSLSYSLPKSLISKLKIDRARFYFQAQNVLTITPYKGLDPESQTYLPPLGMYTLGVQLTF